MEDLGNENMPRSNGVLSSHSEHRNSANTPKNGSVLFFDERTVCRCSAKKHMDKLRRELERKANAFERDKQYIRQRLEEVEFREAKLSEAMRQLAVQQEQLDSYKMYLQDKQGKVSRMYQNYEQSQSDLMQKMDECLLLEKDYKRKLAEYEAALYEVKQKELMISETSGALCARKDELERLENRILHESEKIKFLQEQCSSAREKMQSELRSHNKRMLDENEQIEVRKKRLLEQENMLRTEKDKLDDASRLKSFELDRKLKEATEMVEYNSRLAEELKRKEDAVRREKALISNEWSKLNQSSEQLNNDRNEVLNIRQDLNMRYKQLELSHSQSDFNTSNFNETRLKNMENEVNKKLEYINNREQGIKTKELELERLEATLNKRKHDLDEREKKLDELAKELDKKARDLEHTSDRNKPFDPQINDYKDRMALFSIERNSLDGQIEQFNAKRMTTQMELNAINQRLSLREKQINDKFNQLRGMQGHSDLFNKVNSLKGNKRPQAFSVADDQALN